ANLVFRREVWKGPRRRQGTIPTVSTSSGTDGSNPAPSSAESAANLTPSIRVPNCSYRVIGCRTRIVARDYLPHSEWCDATRRSLSSTSHRPRLQRARRVDSAVVPGWGLEPRRRFDAVIALRTGTVPHTRSWS